MKTPCLRLLAAIASLLLLSACSAEMENPAAAPSAAATPAAVAGEYSGHIETAAGRYAFTPRSCAMHMEDGEMDIEVGGPGTAPDGEKIFVEFSSTANELEVKLGVDTPFSSSDRTLKAGRYVTEELALEVSGRTIRVRSLELVDTDGKRQPGSLEINC